ncbi:MAG: type II secretion system F family protein [Candidatus Latescibacterota bacterium]|nr:MAG: type II secretion system F family protein [Candidatus Latescibacterota bacterium]
MTVTYAWKGKTAAGEAVTGETTVENRKELANVLRKRRVLATDVKEKKAAGKKRKRGSIKTNDLAIFTRQFATMINAGLPIVQCLDTLAKQVSKERFREAIQQVTRDVETGSTLAEALGKHKSIFTDLYVSMVEAGESGGILDVILQRLSVFLEKLDALKRKVKTAMVYPSVVLTVAVLATVFMLVFIIPTFAKMFSDFGGTLPLPTRIVMTLSGVLRGQWYVLVGLVAAAVFAFKRYRATEKGKLKIDAILLRIPAIGDILRKAAVARFTRTLGTLISSGVPILDGLSITARTAGNMVVHNAVMQTRVSIREGQTIAEPLRNSGVFPPMVVQMIAIGEETGALDEMLEKIADFYEQEVDAAVDALTSIIEPVMIVVMGGMVGGMVVAMYLPIFRMVNVIMANQ